MGFFLADPINAPKIPPSITGNLSNRDCQRGMPSLYFIFIILAIKRARVTVAKKVREERSIPDLDLLAVTSPPMMVATVMEIVDTSGISLLGSGFFEMIIAPKSPSIARHPKNTINPKIAERRLLGFCVSL